jgi:hypothetical protein
MKLIVGNLFLNIGKVTGETIYNLLKLAESEIDANERPLHPHKINKVTNFEFS